MRRAVSLAFVGSLGCGPAVATGGASGASTGADASGTRGGGSTDGGDVTTAAPETDDAGSGTTTGGPTMHCQVEVLESTQLSVERFGTLTVPRGHPQLLLLGGTGWTLSGTFGAPFAARFLEPLGEMLAGRFGPGGGWAYAHVSADVVNVLPLDDPDTASEIIIENNAPMLVGDVDEDGLDDLIAFDDGYARVWRADGAGGFDLLAESEERYPNAFHGFAAATDAAPAAVLITNGSSFAGTLGLERSGGVLQEAYAIDTGLVWSIQGVSPSGRGTRALLTASSGGILLDPLIGHVGFLGERDGVWTGRGYDLGTELAAEPKATDLDADGVLDAVAVGRNSKLLGACSAGEELEPCLEVPLAGVPESVAVDDDGQVYVATEDGGLWLFRLGACL